MCWYLMMSVPNRSHTVRGLLRITAFSHYIIWFQFIVPNCQSQSQILRVSIECKVWLSLGGWGWRVRGADTLH